MAAKVKPETGRTPTGIELVEDQVVIRAREREVIRLREGEGLTFEQIGQRLGVSIATVHEDYVRLAKRIADSADKMFPQWRAEHVMRVAELYQKALREFELSKTAKVRRRMQRAVPGKGDAQPSVTELQQMDEQNETGDPKFLDQAVRAASLLGELLGMMSKNGNGDEAPIVAQPGLVSGPVIEVSATVLQASPGVRAALERFEKSERQRLLKPVEKKEGTG